MSFFNHFLNSSVRILDYVKTLDWLANHASLCIVNSNNSLAVCIFTGINSTDAYRTIVLNTELAY